MPFVNAKAGLNNLYRFSFGCSSTRMKAYGVVALSTFTYGVVNELIFNRALENVSKEAAVLAGMLSIALACRYNLSSSQNRNTDIYWRAAPPEISQEDLGNRSDTIPSIESTVIGEPTVLPHVPVIPPREPSTPVLPPENLIDGNPSLRQVTDDIARPIEWRLGRRWWLCFAIAFAALLNLGGMISYLFAKGVGISGLNNSVGWAFDITNFIFWLGIGCAGTFISAILLLFRQQWRTSIHRLAEAMAIFAVMCAGMFLAIHMGRPWDAFFIFPYFPNQRGPIWVNFRSPLMWNLIAISTYLTITLVFWYLGMIPDLATLRDRAAGGIKKLVFRLLSLGWDGSHRTWSRYEIVSLVLAGLATPLALSVQSVVSMDFATSLLPGWHTTILPPYFVTGAIYSGCGMVLMLLIITRSTMHLQRYITLRHLDKMAKITMLTGMIVAYAYLTEFFAAWYGGDLYERYHFIDRATGPYAWCFYLMVLCNVITPQLLWSRKARTNVPFLLIVAILVNIGMWLERFVIVVVSLHRAFLPSDWGMFYPTIFDIGIMVGTFGFFIVCFLLFIRFLPMIAMWEIKGVVGHGAHKLALSHEDKGEEEQLPRAVGTLEKHIK